MHIVIFHMLTFVGCIGAGTILGFYVPWWARLDTTRWRTRLGDRRTVRFTTREDAQQCCLFFGVAPALLGVLGLIIGAVALVFPPDVDQTSHSVLLRLLNTVYFSFLMFGVIGQVSLVTAWNTRRWPSDPQRGSRLSRWMLSRADALIGICGRTRSK
ncbi:MAG: hypothetical protein AAF297_06490 [Planctomycetota bacterium]